MGYFVGEGIIRMFNLNIDIPEMYKDTNGLIRNKPNQSGYYVNGNKWIITKYGEYGYAPKSLDSLITVIGDSYIQNIMNPPECHQAAFLNSMADRYNFYPSARGGAGFIEFLEMAKSLDHLKPIKQLLYVHHGDFVESIKEISRNPNTVQLSLKTEIVTFPESSQSNLKRILYKFEFAYFMYRNYFQKSINAPANNRDDKNLEIDYPKIDSLLDYITSNYDTQNIILVFSPDSDPKITEMTVKHNFESITLKAEDYKSWQLSNDSHWSCHGHKESALQVSKFLNDANF